MGSTRGGEIAEKTFARPLDRAKQRGVAGTSPGNCRAARGECAKNLTDNATRVKSIGQIFGLRPEKAPAFAQQEVQRSRFQPSAVGCERRLRRRSSGHPVQQSAAQAQVVNSIGVRDASHSLIHRHDSFPRAFSRCNFPPQTSFASFSRLSRFNSSLLPPPSASLRLRGEKE